MADKPEPETPDAEPKSDKDAKVEARKALHEQQKRELPSNDWPGKGAA